MIEPKHRAIPITRQCELLGLARASYYHRPEPEDDENLRLLKLIDETHLAHPAFGSRQMTCWLRRQKEPVNRKRVRRLMHRMGLVAIYPKPNLSRKHPQHAVFPYLLRELDVTRPNQVWAMDITYLPIQGGFIYLCTVIDWYSRAVLAWDMSNTLDAGFCVTAVDRAIAEPGIPEILNTAQGCQFT
jgi:putative transposase